MFVPLLHLNILELLPCLLRIRKANVFFIQHNANEELAITSLSCQIYLPLNSHESLLRFSSVTR